MVGRRSSSTFALAFSSASAFPLALALALAASAAGRCCGKSGVVTDRDGDDWPEATSSPYLVQDIACLTVADVGLCDLVVLQALLLQDLLADLHVESCTVGEESVHDVLMSVVLIVLIIVLLVVVVVVVVGVVVVVLLVLHVVRGTRVAVVVLTVALVAIVLDDVLLAIVMAIAVGASNRTSVEPPVRRRILAVHVP